jgi:hypothetical protein
LSRSTLVLVGREVEDGSMEDGQVEELRRWAQGLSTDGRAEVKAAAKAILLLADDLLAARSQLLEERMIRQALEERDAAEAQHAPVDRAGVARDLLDRARSHLQRRAARTPG